MSSKDGVGQVIKAFVAVVALIALTGRFRVIKATLDDVFGLSRGTHGAVGPAQLTNRLITLHIVDEILDVDLHDWTPVRNRGTRCRQCTRSSHPTTLESNMSVSRRCGPDGLSGAWEPAAGEEVVRLHIDGLALQPP